MKKICKSLTVSLAILPLLAFGETTLNTLITSLSSSVLKPLVGVLLTTALLVFFWGMIKYIKSIGSEKDKKDGKDMMVWGVIAMFVMVSVWGLVDFIVGTFGLDNSRVPSPIVLPGTSANTANPRDNPNNGGDWALYP